MLLISLGIIGALIKKNNTGIMGLKFEEGPNPIKGTASCLLTLIRESESNSSSTCCSSSSTKTLSLLDRLRTPIPSTLARRGKKAGVAKELVSRGHKSRGGNSRGHFNSHLNAYSNSHLN